MNFPCNPILISNESVMPPSYFLLLSLKLSYNIRLFLIKSLLDMKIYLLIYDGYALYYNNIHFRLLTYLLCILAIAKQGSITEHTEKRVNTVS